MAKKLIRMMKYIILKLLWYTKVRRRYDPALNSAEAFKTLFQLRPNNYQESSAADLVIDEKIDVSIIIPIYNAEAWIDDCINSIIGQSTKYRIELCLVDDGSTDSSGSIIEAYSYDRRVKVIHQKNSGVSCARNRGLDEVSGKYIMFVDHDDLLENGAIDKLLDYAYKFDADIVEGGYQEFPKERIISKPFQIIQNDVASIMSKAAGYCWNKIYKREIWKEIRFPEKINFEDTLLHLVVYSTINKMVIIPDVVYRYRINLKGIMHTHRIDAKSIDTLWVVDALMQYRETLGLEMNGEIYQFLLFQLSTMNYGRIKSYSEEVKKSVFCISCDIIKSYKQINVHLNKSQRVVESAFLKNDYTLWKICSRLDDYEQRLLDIK